MKSLGILVLVVALGMGAAWLLGSTGRPGAPRGSSLEARAAGVASAPARLLEPGAALPPVEGAALQREEVEPAQASRSEGQSGRAWLVVRVLARESGQPLAGVHAILTSPHMAGAWLVQGPRWAFESEVERTACPCPVTDADGRVQLEARAGQESTLIVNALERVHARPETLSVTPLLEGERREVELRLETRDDLRWFGRVLDDGTGAPLAGASAEWRSGARRPAFSAADGMLVLDFASWQASEVEIALAGYLSNSLALERGHESVELARPIRLVRPAALEVRVRDGQGAPRAGVRVEVMDLEPQAESELAAFGLGRASDGEGGCTFEGLPPRVRLSVAARGGLGRTRRQDVILAPGERRVLEFELESGCRVLGQAVDEDGQPLAGLDLWRLARGELPALRELAHEGAVVDKARTDERGRFVFEHVPAGEWWIGPAPTRGVARVAPLATRVAILPGEARLELTLVCATARYLHGRVLSPEGRGGFAKVTAWQAGTRLVTESRSAGRFVVGPLSEGDWFLQAQAIPREVSPSSAAPSAVARAEVGQSDVVLRLRSGMILAGTVLDERGTRVPGAEVSLSPDEYGFASVATTDELGFFSLGAQAPGGYRLWARSGASVATLGPLAIDARQALAPVELRLEAGAELRLRLASDARNGLEARVSWDGVPCLVVALRPGVELWRTLPPGPVVVRLVRRGRDGDSTVVEERALMLRVGEPNLVELVGSERDAQR